MNTAQLLEHFDRIAEAPDAVPRLRRFILDLAVRGKLVEQDPHDEPASELLKRISPERELLQEFRPHRKDQRTLPIRRDEPPFAAPPQWQFVCLGDVLEMINGRAFKPTDWIESGLPIVRIQNLNNSAAPFNFCDPKTVDERHIIRDHDFLISWSGTPGTSFGAFIWKRGTAALNQHIFRCVQIGEAFAPDFLRLAINSQLDVLIGKAQGGVGLQHVTKGTLEALPLPLPPRSEQHRIVAKVDELMALSDRLEAAQKKREQRRDRLVAASLNRINQPAPSAEGEAATAFREHARFHLDHLPRLTTRPEHIKSLRQTILNLAVCGKLVPQDQEDEPAIELLKRISEAREHPRRIAFAIDPAAEPFRLPSTWHWSSLDELVVAGPQNGISPKPTKREDAPKAITLTATTSGVFNPAHFKRVEAKIADDSDFWLTAGDLLFQRGNTREYVGIAAIYDGPPKTFLFPDLMIRVRLSHFVNLRFIHLAAISPPARTFLSQSASGAQATMPKINQTTLLSLPLPLPPLAEQHRIVAKVDELMAVCDQLEAQLTTTQSDSRRLLEAVLHETLAPAMEIAA